MKTSLVFAVGAGIFFIPFISATGAVATNISSPKYRLETGNVSFESPDKHLDYTKDNLSPTPSPYENPLYNEQGYIAREGYSYEQSGDAFSLTLTPASVLYKELFPDLPIERNIDITISTTPHYPYQVLTGIDDSLRSTQSSTIPSTTCDPKMHCTPIKAGQWLIPATHGLGFSVQGSQSLPDFHNGQLYRPFGIIKDQGASQIISGKVDGSGTSAHKLTVKLSIGEDLPAGIYQNTIKIIAIPGY